MGKFTKENFYKVMCDHFTGVGNEWDEEDDLESFNSIFESLWKDLTEKHPEIFPSYEVIVGDLAGNPAWTENFDTKEKLITTLDDEEYWGGRVILAIYDCDGRNIMEDLEEHIHDENH